MDVRRACRHMVSLGFRLPHGVMPGSRPGGIDPDFTRAEWLDYAWNPIPGMDGLPGTAGFDPQASAKFSWRQLVWADREGELLELRERLAREVDQEARARITAAYGADDWDDEIQRRLAGRHTAAQDTERDRLRAKYQALKKGFETMPLDALRTFDPTADAHWKQPRNGA